MRRRVVEATVVEARVDGAVVDVARCSPAIRVGGRPRSPAWRRDTDWLSMLAKDAGAAARHSEAMRGDARRVVQCGYGGARRGWTTTARETQAGGFVSSADCKK